MPEAESLTETGLTLAAARERIDDHSGKEHQTGNDKFDACREVEQTHAVIDAGDNECSEYGAGELTASTEQAGTPDNRSRNDKQQQAPAACVRRH